MNERELRWSEAMRAARRGDAAAYARLLEEIAQSARAVVGARLHGAGDDVEDVVQEVLIGVHKMRHRYREMLRRRDLSFEEWQEIIDDTAKDPLLATIDVEGHLRQLTAAQQEIVRALMIDGQSVRQVAGRTNRSEGAVRVTLHRALKRLRDLTGKDGPEQVAMTLD